MSIGSSKASVERSSHSSRPRTAGRNSLAAGIRSAPVTDERRSGIRRVLGYARAYELLQHAVGSRRSHVTFVTDYVRPRPGDRILDLGCGPAHILEALPSGVE